MLWKFITRIVVLCITTNIILAYDYYIHNNYYECKLGAKTPYRCVANYDDTPLKYPGCVEKKIWLILRHGTRYPGKKFVPRMIDELPQLRDIIIKAYEEGKTKLLPEDATLLRKWIVPLLSRDAMKLAVEGENEMIDLGERYQARFPSLMPEAYNNNTYKFRYTSTQRTEESAKHFAVGLFGWKNSQNVSYPVSMYQDPVIRFYKRCPRWRQEVDKNPNAKAEKTKFVNSKIVKDMLNNIRDRIGYDIDYG